MGVRAIACVLASGLALVGCTKDEPPPTTLPPVTSGQPSVAPSQAPSPTFAGDSRGASGFASLFVSSIGAAFANADPSFLRSASAPGCGGCEQLITSVEGLRSRGEKRLGGDYFDVRAVAPGVVNGDVVVDVRYRRDAGKVVDAKGVTIASAPATPMTLAQVRLLRNGESWLVQGFRVVEQ